MERLVALIEWIQSLYPFLGSELSQCVRVISFEPSGMTIAVPERQWSGMIDSAGALLRTTLNESFGTDYALTIHSCERDDDRLRAKLFLIERSDWSRKHVQPVRNVQYKTQSLSRRKNS